VWVFLSRRLRRYLFLVVALPLIGRLLEALGERVAASRPGASRGLRDAGRRLQSRRRRGRSGRSGRS